jgi:para-nitrobenzyl esterase
VNFAHHSDPNITLLDGTISWPGYDEDARATLLIDGKDSIAYDPDGNIRQAWGEEVIGYK